MNSYSRARQVSFVHHGDGANGQRIDGRAQGVDAEGLGQDAIELGNDLHAIIVPFPQRLAQAIAIEPGVGNARDHYC